MALHYKASGCCSSLPYNRSAPLLLARYTSTRTLSYSIHTYDMKQNGPSTATTSASAPSRMITRSMTKAQLLGDIANTAPVAGGSLAAHPSNATLPDSGNSTIVEDDSVSAKYVSKSATRRTRREVTSVNHQARPRKAPFEDIPFKVRISAYCLIMPQSHGHPADGRQSAGSYTASRGVALGIREGSLSTQLCTQADFIWFYIISSAAGAATTAHNPVVRSQ
ncbi:hypothetical protein NUW54_g11859 [Trametes sanguinea]|uniref:Uncharacterized protein n=1 Tax=Trametes sanguinea TaxID=158606 RepID=A0ACC1N5V0_9APHY|nr:hypothetical protein NUW54_g11859 [Trametes sanguinea]